MKNRNFCISRNLTVLRQIHKYSQEEVAEKIGVSRQAVAKWESGETAPDLINCDALAELYNVSVDDLTSWNRLSPWRFLSEIYGVSAKSCSPGRGRQGG